jgi:hypothetical protein
MKANPKLFNKKDWLLKEDGDEKEVVMKFYEKRCGDSGCNSDDGVRKSYFRKIFPKNSKKMEFKQN